MLYAQLAVIVSLMTTTAVRKAIRGTRPLEPARITPPERTQVGKDVVETFTYGQDLFASMIEAIESAEDRILFETYIIKGDSVGKRFKKALVEAADRGVKVYVIYDGFANLVVSPRFLTFPPSIRVLRYPIFGAGILFFNLRKLGRDHRKILVVDDTTAFVGGYNIGKDYERKWRDTHLRLEGPSVWDLDNAFVDFWNMHHDEADHISEKGVASWDPKIRAHRNVPRQLIFPIRGMYLEAIDRAKRHIYITQAYFIPDRDILAALMIAAKRGVDVQILVPEVSNHVVADWLSRGFYTKLLASGIRIQLYQDAMVHAKTATIDGEWATIGTANIDRLSLTGNYEINIEALDQSLATRMEHIFANDSKFARELTEEEWSRRHVVAKLCEWILVPLRPLL